MPLLHVRPSGFIRDRYEIQRRSSATEETGIQVGIARDIHDAGCLSVDVVLLQRFGISLIAIGVFEEDAIAATDGPLLTQSLDPRCWRRGRSGQDRNSKPDYFSRNRFQRSSSAIRRLTSGVE